MTSILGISAYYHDSAAALIVDGNIYIDLTSAFGVALLGHAHESVLSSMNEAASFIHGMGDIHPPEPKLTLLEKLARFSPWPDAKVILSTGKNKEIRNSLKYLNLKTISLHRIRYSSIEIGDLKEGEYKDLTDIEISNFLT